jgi:hypothetical protein
MGWSALKFIRTAKRPRDPRALPAGPEERTREGRPRGKRSKRPRSRYRQPPSLSSRSLFESKFLASPEQTDGFSNALLASLRPLRRMNPDDEVTTMGRREFLEELPSLGVLPESLAKRRGGWKRIQRLSKVTNMVAPCRRAARSIGPSLARGHAPLSLAIRLILVHDLATRIERRTWRV